MAERATAVIIHFLVPALGLMFYIYLALRMHRKKVVDPPYVGLFAVFVLWGGVLLILLTALFWYWSGIATLGLFALVFGAPLPLGLVALSNYNKRKQSHFHSWVLWLSLGFLILILFVLVLWKMGLRNIIHI
jgi:FtsH-binding integral membrane protein